MTNSRNAQTNFLSLLASQLLTCNLLVKYDSTGRAELIRVPLAAHSDDHAREHMEVWFDSGAHSKSLSLSRIFPFSCNSASGRTESAEGQPKCLQDLARANMDILIVYTMCTFVITSWHGPQCACKSSDVLRKACAMSGWRVTAHGLCSVQSVGHPQSGCASNTSNRCCSCCLCDGHEAVETVWQSATLGKAPMARILTSLNILYCVSGKIIDQTRARAILCAIHVNPNYDEMPWKGGP